MRRVNKPEEYVTREVAAATLREIADVIAAGVERRLVKIYVNIYSAERADVEAALAKCGQSPRRDVGNAMLRQPNWSE